MIRFAKTEDSCALLRIYSQYIDTAITFEYTLPTQREFARRIQTTKQEYPYLVCEENGCITGYAYAHRYQAREAYQWNAELSVYIDREQTSKGLGRRFYHILVEMLKRQGVKTVYGLVCLPNEKSERLHHSLGFTHLGTYHNTGFKCGAWHDVALFEKQIAEYNTDPAPFLPLCELPGDSLAAILQQVPS